MVGKHGLAGGNLYRHFAFGFYAKGLIDFDQPFRTDVFGEIDNGLGAVCFGCRFFVLAAGIAAGTDCKGGQQGQDAEV